MWNRFLPHQGEETLSGNFIFLIGGLVIFFTIIRVPFLELWDKKNKAKHNGGSVGWASGCDAGGREFDSGLTNTWNNWGESAAFVIKSANC